MAMRKLTDCQGSVLWLSGMYVSVSGCIVAIRNETDCKRPLLLL